MYFVLKHFLSLAKVHSVCPCLLLLHISSVIPIMFLLLLFTFLLANPALWEISGDEVRKITSLLKSGDGISGAAKPKLNLDIYYESLCPDSIRFIVNQVADTWEDLGGDDVGFRFIPYGFAETTETDGGYSFECQHGPRECYGNMVQACTLAHIEDMDTQIALLTCMEGSPAPDTAGPYCFQKYSLDFGPVMECVEGSEGGSLLAANGVEQNGLNPKPNNVPWVNFNGEHIAEYWELEYMGLTNFICDTFQLAGCP